MSKVLVVDDKRASRVTVAITLRKQGYEVDESSCIMEAIEFIKKKSYDLIITDMRMPIKPNMIDDPEGGFKIITAAKAIDKNVAIIVITAYASMDNAVESTRLGGTNYLVKEFSKSELEMKAAMALEQRKLDLEKQKLSDENVLLRELEKSVGVQQKLLPEHTPELPGIEISVLYRPMMGVSGDYYDFIEINEKQVGLALGDVSGKGISAAMIMASLRASLRAQVKAFPNSVSDLLSQLNKIVYQDTQEYSFVTIIYGILDVNDYTFTYSLAGHPPILHYKAKAKTVEQLNVGGIMLGLLEDSKYTAEKVDLTAGDALVLYSDGITEACNTSGDLFDIDQLCDLVDHHGLKSAEELKETIFGAVSKYTQNVWEDDVTIMIVKVY